MPRHVLNHIIYFVSHHRSPCLQGLISWNVLCCKYKNKLGTVKALERILLRSAPALLWNHGPTAPRPFGQDQVCCHGPQTFCCFSSQVQGAAFLWHSRSSEGCAIVFHPYPEILLSTSQNTGMQAYQDRLCFWMMSVP